MRLLAPNAPGKSAPGGPRSIWVLPEGPRKWGRSSLADSSLVFPAVDSAKQKISRSREHPSQRERAVLRVVRPLADAPLRELPLLLREELPVVRREVPL